MTPRAAQEMLDDRSFAGYTSREAQASAHAAAQPHVPEDVLGTMLQSVIQEALERSLTRSSRPRGTNAA